MLKQTSKQMPGPGFLKSVGYGFRFQNNYLYPLFDLFREYGDYVMFAGGRKVLIAYHPEAVEHVLKKNAKNYLKAPDMVELHPMLGEGLLTSEGETWREHRRLIGSEFQQKKVEALYPVMVRHLEATLHRLQNATEVIDIAPELSRLTYGIAGECFFGANVDESAGTVYKNIEISAEVTVRRMAMAFKIPFSWPLPSHNRVRKAVREMDEIVFNIIDKRIAQQTDSHDVLSRLIRIQPESGYKQLSRKQLRDEVMTLLLAGHETTANTLSWTLYLLGRHPDIQKKLRDEVMAAVSDQVPTLIELRKLVFTKAVIEESMRLFSPAATIGRQNIEEDELGGYYIPKGSVVNLSQWVTHRHPEFWTDPDEFKPERFMSPIHNPYAYFPFSHGPRECVGKNMAIIEAIALLAGLIRNFEFTLIREDVRPRALITVRPDPGIFMKIHPLSASWL